MLQRLIAANPRTVPCVITVWRTSDSCQFTHRFIPSIYF